MENKKYGEYASTLYDTGLQNIFDNYQQYIGVLDQKKQSDLHDAYYMREMSKKYLGELASNTGVGDVSGNLLDIYGSYMQNIDKINEHYGDLSFNLQQSYEERRFDLYRNKMEYLIGKEEEQIGKENLAFAYEAVNRSIDSDDPLASLESNKQAFFERGLHEEYYMSLQGIKQDLAETFNELLASGMWGTKVNEDGTVSSVTDVTEFIENNYKKYGLSEKEKNSKIAFINEMNVKMEENQAIPYYNIDYSTEEFKNFFANQVVNSNYFNLDDKYANDIKISEIDEEKVYFTYLKESVDEVGDVTSGDIMNALTTLYGDGVQITNGQMVDFTKTSTALSQAGLSHVNGQFIYVNGAFHKVEFLNKLNMLDSYKKQKDLNLTAENKALLNYRTKAGLDEFTFNDIVYKEQKNPVKYKYGKDNTGLAAKLREAYRQVHGGLENGRFKDKTIVFYEGYFWVFHSSGNIYKADKKQN